jgi:hypothetical protein
MDKTGTHWYRHHNQHERTAFLVKFMLLHHGPCADTDALCLDLVETIQEYWTDRDIDWRQ